MAENGARRVALYLAYGSMLDKKMEEESFSVLKKIISSFGPGHWVFEGARKQLDQRLGPNCWNKLKVLVREGKEVAT